MRLLLCALLLLFALEGSADTILINNKLTAQTTLYRHEIQSIFMLRPAYWTNGEKIIPIFINFDDIVHIRFVSDMLHLSPVNFEIIMQDKVQQGETWQYIMVPDVKAAVYAVKHTPGSIAYIPSAMIVDNTNVQVIKVYE